MIPLSMLAALAVPTAWSLWSVLPPLADEVPAPEDVKPGWLGFGVVLVLAAVVVLLFFSFRKQLRRVDFEEEPDRDRPGGDEE
jgi:hypothetical protein